jgi:putative two-component system response regulator
MERELIAGSRILIVDDLEANVILLERILQHAGYKNYMSTTDPREFLDRFRTFQPDLILLDLMMPNLDGYALIKQLYGWIPEGVYLPIMVMTADTSKAARQKALGLGAKDFLTKPIDAIEAALRISNLLLTRNLYLQMESKNRTYAAHADASKRHLAAALQELERIDSRHRVIPEDLLRLRSELREASRAIGCLSNDDPPPVSPAFVEPEAPGSARISAA